MSCNKHPKYRGIRKPAAGCGWCKLTWAARKARKLLGLPVEERKLKLTAPSSELPGAPESRL